MSVGRRKNNAYCLDPKATTTLSESRFYAALLALFLAFGLWLPTAMAQTDSQDSQNTESPTADSSSTERVISNLTLKDGEELPRSETGEQIHQDIIEVLKGDDFGEQKTVKRWRWIDTEDEEARDAKFPEWLIDFYDFLERNEGTLSVISSTLEIFLWAALIGLILFLVIRYRESIRLLVTGAMNGAPEPELPASLMGIDLKKVVLPNDIPNEARALWQQQQPRKAVALLLRASLIKLLREHRVKLYDSDTEAECCDRIEQQAPMTVSRYMRDLVTAWQSLAYAHIAPSETVFNDLCSRWGEVFDRLVHARPSDEKEVSHAE